MQQSSTTYDTHLERRRGGPASRQREESTAETRIPWYSVCSTWPLSALVWDTSDRMSTTPTETSDPSIEVSIGIAHRNNYALLRNCVESIVDSTQGVSYEIIVVDNASTDGSAEAVVREFPRVRVIRNDIPRGYGASNNQAFAESTGRNFLVLNNDTLFKPRVLETLTEYLRDDTSIGCVGCRILNPDGSLQHSCSRRINIWTQFFDDLVPANLLAPRSKFRLRLYHWNHDEEREVNVVLGAFMLFPRRVFEQIGGFDEDFEFFAEEFDICERVCAAGYSVRFSPRASIVHLGGQTMEAEPIKHYITRQQSRQTYFKKHHSAFQALLFRCSAFVGVCLRLVGWSVAGIVARRRREDAKRMVAQYASVLPQILPWSRAWRSSSNHLP